MISEDQSNLTVQSCVIIKKKEKKAAIFNRIDMISCSTERFNVNLAFASAG